jgi:hypothetical protein
VELNSIFVLKTDLYGKVSMHQYSAGILFPLLPLLFIAGPEVQIAFLRHEI